MVSRISFALGLLVLLAPALAAQATTEPAPGLRPPRLNTDSVFVSFLPTAPRAVDAGLVAPRTLRFDPFAHAPRADDAAAAPSLPDVSALPRCTMPVQRADSIHDPMPIATPDSAEEYFIRVAPPGCVAEPSR